MRRSRGFKLLEVMVAAAVFFTVAILFLNLLPASFGARKQADNRVGASTVAHSKIEELRQGRFSDLVVGISGPETVPLNGTKFQLQTEVSEVADREPSLLKSVTIRVSWSERSGSKSMTIESYISAVRR